MTEEKEKPAGVKEPDAVESTEPEELSTKPGRGPVTVMALIIIALLVVLISLNLRARSGGGAADEDAVLAYRAEVESLREELNRQLREEGRPPVESGSESIGEIAARLRKDSNTLVGLAGRFQEMLAEKDGQIAEKTAALIQAEKQRQAAIVESQRMQSELQRALADSSEADLLRREATGLRARIDALAAELSAARQELSSRDEQPSGEDYADLKRRFEETLKAKEFFEERVKELEAGL